MEKTECYGCHQEFRPLEGVILSLPSDRYADAGHPGMLQVRIQVADLLPTSQGQPDFWTAGEIHGVARHPHEPDSSLSMDALAIDPKICQSIDVYADWLRIKRALQVEEMRLENERASAALRAVVVLNDLWQLRDRQRV